MHRASRLAAPTRVSSRFLRSLAAAAGVAALVAGCAGGSGTTAPGGSAGGAGSGSNSVAGTSSTGSASSPASQGSPLDRVAGLPAFKHIYLIVLENESYSNLIGSGDAPYLGSLAKQYAVAANYSAITHPSQPNYIALFSGSTQGVTGDGHYDLGGQNLVDQLESKGKTWAVFAQGYPGGCDLHASGPSVTDGPGEPGPYARKHNPAISFTDVSSNPTRCGHITNLSAFSPSAADFEMIVPNLCNDMHSCSVGIGDAFLKAFVPKILDSPEFAGSVLFITWDEGIGSTNRIATIAVSSGMTAPSRYAVRSDHYSLLRTIEDAWGMPALGLAAKATPLQFPY